VNGIKDDRTPEVEADEQSRSHWRWIIPLLIILFFVALMGYVVTRRVNEEMDEGNDDDDNEENDGDKPRGAGSEAGDQGGDQGSDHGGADHGDQGSDHGDQGSDHGSQGFAGGPASSAQLVQAQPVESKDSGGSISKSLSPGIVDLGSGSDSE
jgi:hypothetical protein